MGKTSRETQARQSFSGHEAATGLSFPHGGKTRPTQGQLKRKAVSGECSLSATTQHAGDTLLSLGDLN